MYLAYLNALTRFNLFFNGTIRNRKERFLVLEEEERETIRCETKLL